MSNTEDRAPRQGPPSPSLPAPPMWEAGRPHRPAIIISPSSPRPHIPAPPLLTPLLRKRPLTLMDFWPTTRSVKAGRPAPGSPPDALPRPRGGRRRTRDQPESHGPTKLARPTPDHVSRTPSPPPVPVESLLVGPAGPPAPQARPAPTTSPTDVLFMGPVPPQALQAVSPSGDVRLTLRRYSLGDTLDSPQLFLRLDLRIHPRDLYSIPSDGHCGYHSLAVLAHPLYPTPRPRLTPPPAPS